jgi:hypothetical protein
MNRRHNRLIGILILLLGLVASHVALAEVTSIVSADPQFAEQGTVGTPITIKGTGFDKTVKEVRFLVHCRPEGSCIDDPGGITVTGFKLNQPTEPDTEPEIVATINVSDTAKIGDFDIAMTTRTRGRGGKGTTFKSGNLFKVTPLRPNQTLVLCDEILKDPHGSCTCKFSWDGNENIYGLLESCVTSETLRLKSMIRTAGSIQANGTERLSITAVLCGSQLLHPQTCRDSENLDGVPLGTFSGSSVIENWFHRARIRFLDIRFGVDAFGDAPSRGCDALNDDIQSAVSFVLRADGNIATDTPDPTSALPEEEPDERYRHSWFDVDNIGIYSEDDPLCYGVEIRRTPEYTEEYTNNSDTWVQEFPARDARVGLSNIEISEGSYIKAGILMKGIMPMSSNNPPYIIGNTIEAAGCENDVVENYVAKAIHFWGLTPDPDNQIEGVVESNAIDMTNTCITPDYAYTAGVQVDGDEGGTQTTVKVNKNEISGAYVGVDVDGNVVDVNFSGNTLTGDGERESGDTGILSDAQCTRTKGKPNNIVGYDFDILKSDPNCF